MNVGARSESLSVVVDRMKVLPYPWGYSVPPSIHLPQYSIHTLVSNNGKPKNPKNHTCGKGENVEGKIYEDVGFNVCAFDTWYDICWGDPTYTTYFD